MGDQNGGGGGGLGSRLIGVTHHILVWSPHRFLCNQVVYSFINGEGKGGEPYVGFLIVPNIATVWDSKVLKQQVERGPESWDTKSVLILYNFEPQSHQCITISRYGIFYPVT